MPFLLYVVCSKTKRNCFTVLHDLYQLGLWLRFKGQRFKGFLLYLEMIVLLSYNSLPSCIVFSMFFSRPSLVPLPFYLALTSKALIGVSVPFPPLSSPTSLWPGMCWASIPAQLLDAYLFCLWFFLKGKNPQALSWSHGSEHHLWVRGDSRWAR